MPNAAETQVEPNLPATAVMTWYQVTLSAIGDGVLTTDPEGRITYMNPVAESLTGWIAGEAHGRPLGDVVRLVNEESREVVEQPVMKVIETGLVRGMANHTLLVAKDGTERPVDDSAAPVRDGDGNLIGVVMVFRDISELRRRERAVQDALTYAESILDTVRDPFVVLDAGFHVRSASRSFYEVFGADPGATEGCLLYELGNSQWDIPQLRALLADVLSSDTSLRDFEVEHTLAGLDRRPAAGAKARTGAGSVAESLPIGRRRHLRVPHPCSASIPGDSPCQGLLRRRSARGRVVPEPR